MHYSKPMVELVYEIRRRVPADLKPAVKLANPELFDELLEHYHLGATTIAKALIKELFALAGIPWQEASTPSVAEPATKGRQIVKVYRGQTRLEPGRDSAVASAPATAEHHKPKKIYRGRVVG